MDHIISRDQLFMKQTIRENKGFTLLEILLVVAAIAILAGIVIVALNPGKQLAESRDAERRSHVNTLLNGTYQYAIDNQGDFPAAINDTAGEVQVIGTACTDPACAAATDAGDTVATSCVDLSADLTPTYLVDIPADPRYGSTEDTQYYIDKTADGRLTVGACQPEEAGTISVTR
jgi:prepilin-type N-terminal cleavage/methylation domain-containing protein